MPCLILTMLIIKILQETITFMNIQYYNITTLQSKKKTNMSAQSEPEKMY